MKSCLNCTYCRLTSLKARKGKIEYHYSCNMFNKKAIFTKAEKCNYYFQKQIRHKEAKDNERLCISK